MKTIKSISPKKKIEVINFLGKTLANTVLSLRRSEWRMLPANICITNETSPVYLPDSGTLHTLTVEEFTGKIIENKFGGSYDSCINFADEQFSSGKKPQDGYVIIQLDTYWNGRNTSWNITVIKND